MAPCALLGSASALTPNIWWAYHVIPQDIGVGVENVRDSGGYLGEKLCRTGRFQDGPVVEGWTAVEVTVMVMPNVDWTLISPQRIRRCESL